MKKQRIETGDFVGGIIEKKFSKILFPYIDKICFMSPNFLTTLRNILVIYIYYSIIKKKYFHNQGLLVILVGILDILDGCYARDYNMTTSFGDWYDHISDWMTTVILFYNGRQRAKYKADLMFDLKATYQEIQVDIDDLFLDKF